MVFVAPSKFTFLSSVSGKRSTREKELEHAQIKAHAARISHQRRNWVKVQQQLKRQQDEHCEDERSYTLGEGDCGSHTTSRSREIILLLPGHGSSDPFDAYSVKITPEVNRLIGYARDVLLPNIFTPPFFKRLTAGAPKWVNYERSDKVIGGSTLLLNIKVFREMSEGAALGWLCSHIPFIQQLNSPEIVQALSVERLKMRAKSLKLLRETLTNHPVSSPEALTAVRLHMRALYEMECMAGDTEAARAHIDILLRLDDPVTDELVRLQHLLVMMFNTTELACKNLERTILPFGEWTSERFASLWMVSSPFMPAPPDTVNHAHASVTIPVVREAMLRLRFCLWIGETPLPFGNAQERLKADMVFAWIVTKTFHDIGMLLNLYFDIIERKIVFHSEGRRLVEACLVLTLLHLFRKCMHSAVVENDIDVRDASHVIIPRLKQDMTAALELMTPAETVYYRDAVLWTLYAGAVYEQRQKRRKGPLRLESDSVGQSWFTCTLARHARDIGITTWERGKATLQTFVYDEHLQPDGSLWFEEVIKGQELVDTSGPSLSSGHEHFNALDKCRSRMGRSKIGDVACDRHDEQQWREVD
ncbi:hypothetical protein H2200_009621 [Cladophialophora chaetospira]|uniref:Uncharacterized protein n=1 Tax=Cladophialophora chaetospira TaxID=386627 RepID=A0AA38X2X0_9EURO|nr:hypothetical protein H2200_009621 [Cladophialophora chaetospira]